MTRLGQISILIISFLVLGCQGERGSTELSNNMPKSFTYLALGDSYTIGEAVEEEERWPVQLKNRLKKEDIVISDLQIVATTGWTTDELLRGMAAEELPEKFDLVSLLIGVNNQYRGYDIGAYEKEFKDLLHQAIALADGNPHNVFVVSIPDYGVTPFAKEKALDPSKIAKELDEYNATAEKISLISDVRFFKITEESRKAAEDPTLIAEDGLHPSGKMYKQWVDEVYSYVKDNLSNR